MQEEQVTAVEVHTVYSLRTVTIQEADGSTETIDTTDTHPFYVEGAGWTSAADLTSGEQLETPNGQSATVLSTAVETEPQGVQVYNFTVADDHTYFVEQASGGDAIWVHNNCQLNRNLIEAGQTRLEGEAGHHIIALASNDENAIAARDILNRFGIGINDAANGVFLPGNLDSLNPLNKTVHSILHTKVYYENVLDELQGASSASEVQDALGKIAQKLINHNFSF